MTTAEKTSLLNGVNAFANGWYVGNTPSIPRLGIPAINNVLDNFFPDRTEIVLDQLKGDNLYPNVVAPSFNQQGGSVNSGFALTMSAPAGVIYYTLDGTDPRLMGGNISSKAVRYTGQIALTENANVKARVLSASTWSALNLADFTIIRTFKELMITELMYNPAPQGNPHPIRRMEGSGHRI